MLPKEGADAQKGASPTPSSHGSEVGDTGDTAPDQMEEVASLEEALSQMGASSKIPFQFTQQNRSPSKWSLLPEHWQDHLAHEHRICYCIHIRVTWGGGGNQPQPFHAWSGALIADMFQDGLEEWITEAIVLAPGETILFCAWWPLKEGLPLGNARPS